MEPALRPQLMPLDRSSRPVAAARALIAEHCRDWPEPRVRVVVLLTSEIVANAVCSTTGPVSMAAALVPGGVRVWVQDADTTPLPCPPGSIPDMPARSATGGRGLPLLGRFASCWGVSPTTAGKQVWFDVPAADAGEHTRASG